MNKRIAVLANEARIEVGQRIGYNDRDRDNAFEQVFAELIIREAAKEAKKYADRSIYSDDYEDCGIECMPRDMENYVLEHFGLE